MRGSFALVTFLACYMSNISFCLDIAMQSRVSMQACNKDAQSTPKLGV